MRVEAYDTLEPDSPSSAEGSGRSCVSSKLRNAIVGSLVFALVAGYFVAGHYMYKVPVGLDPSGFVAGEALHSLALFFAPGLKNAMPGIELLILSLLGIGAVAFFIVRAAVRSRADDVDRARRSFLAGAGTGAGVALGSMVVAGCVAFARGILGLGHGGRGWGDISKHINDEEIVKTHPVWKPDWKRVASATRTGRTWRAWPSTGA